MTAPLAHSDVVRPEWIDYNGHLSEPYYVLVFGDATTALMDHTGMDERYRSATGCSLYTVEAHVRYLREVGPGAALEVHTRVLGRDAKRLRLWHELHVGGRLAATEELMCLHVGPDGPQPFPETVAAGLDRLADPGAPLPEHAGRAIAPVRHGKQSKATGEQGAVRPGEQSKATGEQGTANDASGTVVHRPPT